MASPPFSIAESSPGDSDIVSLHPADERTYRDVVESWLNMIADSTTGKLKIDVAASPSDASYPTGGLAWDTDLSKLKIRLSGGWTSIGPEFPSGTRMVFQQTSAPAGWTKVSDAAYEDAVMLLTTGTVATAGTVAADEFLLNSDHFEDDEFIGYGEFTTDSGGGHTHAPGNGGSFISVGAADNMGTVDIGDGATDITSSAATSSDGSHTHTGSVVVNVFGDETPMFGGGANGVKTVEFIVAQKD